MDDFLKSILPTLSSAGVAGAVLWYFLTRIIPSIEGFKSAMFQEMAKNRESIHALEVAMDRSTKADLLRLIASPHVSNDLKEAATMMVRETDAVLLQSRSSSPAGTDSTKP